MTYQSSSLLPFKAVAAYRTVTSNMKWGTYLRLVGRNIRAARVRAGLRQIDVEEKVGLEYRHYQKIEAGKINISLETIYRLASLFKVTEQDLVRRE